MISLQVFSVLLCVATTFSTPVSVVDQFMPTENVAPIKLYPTSSYNMIWDDRNTGADTDMSNWRAQICFGCLTLGDLATNCDRCQPPTVQTAGAKAGSDDAAFTALANKMYRISTNTPAILLALLLGWGCIAGGSISRFTAPTQFHDPHRPSSLQFVWHDAGSGGTFDVSWWSPVCPGGYTALGSVADNTENEQPDRVLWPACVKNEYLTEGSWSLIYADKGSGAKLDGSAYQANAKLDGVPLYLFTATGCHCKPNVQAMVLKSSAVTIVNTAVAGGALAHMQMDNVMYHTNNTRLLHTALRNHTNKHNQTEQLHQWRTEAELEPGVPVTFVGYLPSDVNTNQQINFISGQSYKSIHNTTVKCMGETNVLQVIKEMDYTADYTFKLDNGQTTKRRLSGKYRTLVETEQCV